MQGSAFDFTQIVGDLELYEQELPSVEESDVVDEELQVAEDDEFEDFSEYQEQTSLLVEDNEADGTEESSDEQR